MAVLCRLGVRVQALRLLVGGLGQLKCEEDTVAPALRGCLANSRQQAPCRVILRVLTVEEIGVHLRLDGGVFVHLQLTHHRRKLGWLQGRDSSFVLGLKSLGAFQRVREGGLDLGVGRRPEEVAEVPPNRLGAGLLQRFCHGGSG